MTHVRALDPISAPLTYPGTAPDGQAVLVTDTDVLRVHPSPIDPVGEWRVELTPPAGDVSLDEILLVHQAAPMARRAPVLAVGSNAAPSQIQRKLAAPGRLTMVPMTAVTAYGLSVGVSAHVSKAGYVPATPVPDPSAKSRLWVTWLAPEELIAMDATEPNYDRVLLPDACSVKLTSGQALSGCWLFVSRHGFLAESSGKPRKLISQSGLIASLLAEVPILTDLVGTSPKEWMNRTQDEQVRDEVRDVFRSAGITRTTDLESWLPD